MYAALALSWNVIGGYAGYPSFSTAGFFGLGAYAGALLQNAGVTPILLAGSRRRSWSPRWLPRSDALSCG